MSNISDSFVYEIPNSTVTPKDVLFGLPNQYTGGAFINLWLIGVYGVLFTGALSFGQGGKKSSLFAGFGTFIITFLMTLAGIAGGNQLIPATIVFLASMVLNYMDKGGQAL